MTLPSVRARSDRAATYPDLETAQWATQQAITLNEQVIHRWLTQSARRRLVVEAAWPTRPEPVGSVLTVGMMLAGQQPLPVRAARVVLLRAAPGDAAPQGFTVHTSFPVDL
ncbi:RNase A-like domain-containing protein [Streptomyces sp. 2RAF24]|uniref:RNase A-like domain-containing protein n=1 Tax=Streptomyces sp. 2RAF24 TaxID=3232997 RepID=UPI003F960629